MVEIQRILCPIDFSECSVIAFDYARSLARHYQARLLLQHVVKRPLLAPIYYSFDFPEFYYQLLRELRTGAEKHLNEFAGSRQLEGIQTEWVVQEGSTANSILSLAKSNTVQLIVMGTHGARGMDRLVMGSVAEKVLRKAGCPVLAVRQPAHALIPSEQNIEPALFRKILYCTDFSDYAHRAFHYAVSLALEYAADLTLLHVVDETLGTRELEHAIRQATERLEHLVQPEARTRCNIKTEVRAGRPYQEIIQFAAQDHTDLIVMGVLGRSAVNLLVFGSVTHRVIQLGPCPVLAVRGFSWRF